MIPLRLEAAKHRENVMGTCDIKKVHIILGLILILYMSLVAACMFIILVQACVYQVFGSSLAMNNAPSIIF